MQKKDLKPLKVAELDKLIEALVHQVEDLEAVTEFKNKDEQIAFILEAYKLCPFTLDVSDKGEVLLPLKFKDVNDGDDSGDDTDEEEESEEDGDNEEVEEIEIKTYNGEVVVSTANRVIGGRFYVDIATTKAVYTITKDEFKNLK